MVDRAWIQGRDAVAILKAASALGKFIIVRRCGTGQQVDADEGLRLVYQGRPIEVDIRADTLADMVACLWRLRE